MAAATLSSTVWTCSTSWIRNARWLALLGAAAYDFAIWVNTHFNRVRRACGLTYWSLSRWAKLRVKNAVSYIGEYESTLSGEARRHGADGVICGHIHHAVIRELSGTLYVNCGDWVESCTAVIEDFDGRLEIVAWTEVRDLRDARVARAEAQARAG
jgi:UDP-2,3-diacylglucosamine pyrophosphatase LpxH